jgi:hypothetical protein
LGHATLAPEPGESLEDEIVFEDEEHTQMILIIHLAGHGGGLDFNTRSVEDLHLGAVGMPIQGDGGEVDDPIALWCGTDEHADRLMSDTAPTIDRVDHGRLDAHQRAQSRRWHQRW